MDYDTASAHDLRAEASQQYAQLLSKGAQAADELVTAAQAEAADIVEAARREADRVTTSASETAQAHAADARRADQARDEALAVVAAAHERLGQLLAEIAPTPPV